MALTESGPKVRDGSSDTINDANQAQEARNAEGLRFYEWMKAKQAANEGRAVGGAGTFGQTGMQLGAKWKRYQFDDGMREYLMETKENGGAGMTEEQAHEYIKKYGEDEYKKFQRGDFDKPEAGGEGDSVGKPEGPQEAGSGEAPSGDTPSGEAAATKPGDAAPTTIEATADAPKTPGAPDVPRAPAEAPATPVAEGTTQATAAGGEAGEAGNAGLVAQTAENATKVKVAAVGAGSGFVAKEVATAPPPPTVVDVSGGAVGSQGTVAVDAAGAPAAAGVEGTAPAVEAAAAPAAAPAAEASAPAAEAAAGAGAAGAEGVSAFASALPWIGAGIAIAALAYTIYVCTRRGGAAGAASAAPGAVAGGAGAVSGAANA